MTRKEKARLRICKARRICRTARGVHDSITLHGKHHDFFFLRSLTREEWLKVGGHVGYMFSANNLPFPPQLDETEIKWWDVPLAREIK